jgi:hypothetical protein
VIEVSLFAQHCHSRAIQTLGLRGLRRELRLLVNCRHKP